MIEKESLNTRCDIGPRITRLSSSSIWFDNSYHRLPVNAETGEGWPRVVRDGPG